MTRAMAVNLGEDNIRCNAIAPGWIASELSATYLASLPDPAAVHEALNVSARWDLPVVFIIDNNP